MNKTKDARSRRLSMFLEGRTEKNERCPVSGSQTVGAFDTRDRYSPRSYFPSMDCWGSMLASSTALVIMNHVERSCPEFCLHLRLAGKWEKLYAQLSPRELPCGGCVHRQTPPATCRIGLPLRYRFVRHAYGDSFPLLTWDQGKRSGLE